MEINNDLHEQFLKKRNNVHNLTSILYNIIDNISNVENYEQLPPFSKIECRTIQLTYNLPDKFYEVHRNISRERHRNLLIDDHIKQAIYKFDEFQNDIIACLNIYKSSDDYNKLNRYTKYAITYAINNPDNCKRFRDNKYDISTLINPNGPPPNFKANSINKFKEETELFHKYRNEFVYALNNLENIHYNLVRGKKPTYSQYESNIIRLYRIVNGSKYPGRETIFLYACSEGNEEAISMFLEELPKWTNEITHVIELYKNSRKKK